MPNLAPCVLPRLRLGPRLRRHREVRLMPNLAPCVLPRLRLGPRLRRHREVRLMPNLAPCVLPRMKVQVRRSFTLPSPLRKEACETPP